MVNKNFVKEGFLPKDIGKYLHNIQTARVESDYKAKDFSVKEVEEFIRQGKEVLDKIESLTSLIINEYRNRN